MNRNSELPVVLSHARTLPAVIKTRGGTHFDPREDRWEIRELTFKTCFSFDLLTGLSYEFRAAFRATLVWYVQNASLRHVHNIYHRARQMFEFKSNSTGETIVEITDADLLNYKAYLGKGREWYLGAMSSFLRRWYTLGYAGVTKEAAVLLEQLRFKGNPKGVATATMDPVKGPFTALELEALQQALNNAYSRRDITLAEFVLCWLVMMLGMRPTQYAALKVCDVVELRGKDGALSYSLHMPRAKTRDSNPRSQFKERLLTPQIGRLVTRYTIEVKARFVDLLENPEDAALFYGKPDHGALAGDCCHRTAKQIGEMLSAVLGKLKVVSERTGEVVHVSAKRFRSTIGTRAAEEGHGELVIAELLDHSDTQHVGVYVASTPAVVERIDRAVAMQMAPLAQAFAGKLIGGPDKASRANEPSCHIRAPQITGNFNAMSSCGKHGFCGFLKPIACYTCNSFEPWLDGPHEEVLEYLIAERERVLTSSDARIASINDRTILAVAQVVQLCNNERIARSAANG